MGETSSISGSSNRRLLRVAAYLEEAGEDPETACDNLLELDIPYIALKQVWTDNIGRIPDPACQKLQKVIQSKKMTVIMLATELGEVSADELKSVRDEEIERIFNRAAYFQAPFIRIGIGKSCSVDCHDEVNEWMNRITHKAIQYNVTPVIEITHNSFVDKPSDIATILLTHKRWKLLYDPAQYILRKKQDPFIKYWTLLKSNTAVIDVRDLKIGKGFKAPGFGDSRIGDTIKDAIDSNYDGWYVIEPSLGRRHGSALSKKETFTQAVSAFDVLLEQ